MTRNFDQTIITVKVGGKDSLESFSCHRELLRRCSTHFDHCLGEKNDSPYKDSEILLDIADTNADVFDAFLMWLYTGFIPHHLIEGGKEVHAPTHSINVNGGDHTIAPECTTSEDVDAASWGVNLVNEDGQQPERKYSSSSEGTIAEKVLSEIEVEKPPQVRNPSEKREIPTETLCPCCSRPYKWRGLEGFLERRFISLYIFAHRYSIPTLRRAVILAWQKNDEVMQCMPDHSNVIAAYESLPPNAPLCRYFLDSYSV